MIIEYEKPVPIELLNCEHNLHLEFTSKHNEFKSLNSGRILVKTCDYRNEENNHHHYTNDFLFNEVLPIISEKLELNVNLTDFEKIKYETNFDYHVPKNDKEVVVFSSTGRKLKGYSKDVLRDPNKKYLSECPGAHTTYQTLYTFMHRCSSIFNLTTDSNRILLLNTDSMISPLVPILALYFKQTIVMDNRTRKSCKYLFSPVQKNISDYIGSFLSRNSLKEEYNLK